MPDHEAGIDAVIGTWGTDDNSDHLSFSCRLRADGAVAVDSPVAIEAAANDEVLGARLTREEALVHPWLSTFWRIVDAVALDDPTVSAAVYGATSGHTPSGAVGALRRLASRLASGRRASGR